MCQKISESSIFFSPGILHSGWKAVFSPFICNPLHSSDCVLRIYLSEKVKINPFFSKWKKQEAQRKRKWTSIYTSEEGVPMTGLTLEKLRPFPHQPFACPLKIFPRPKRDGGPNERTNHPRKGNPFVPIGSRKQFGTNVSFAVLGQESIHRNIEWRPLVCGVLFWPVDSPLGIRIFQDYSTALTRAVQPILKMIFRPHEGCL